MTLADRIEMALMGRFGKGPASRTMLLSTLVDAAVAIDDAQPALEVWMQSALRRQVIEQCPGDSYCYRLHTKANVTRRPNQKDMLMDGDLKSPGASQFFLAQEDGKLAPITKQEVIDGICDETEPPTTAAEWRARAMSKQRIGG